MVKAPEQDVEEVADGVFAQAREAGDSAQQVADNFQKAVDTSVQNQPMTTLFLAGVLGFVLGAIWKA